MSNTWSKPWRIISSVVSFAPDYVQNHVLIYSMPFVNIYYTCSFYSQACRCQMKVLHAQMLLADCCRSVTLASFCAKLIRPLISVLRVWNSISSVTICSKFDYLPSLSCAWRVKAICGYWQPIQQEALAGVYVRPMATSALSCNEKPFCFFFRWLRR